MQRPEFAVRHHLLSNICVALMSTVLCLVFAEGIFRFISYRDDVKTLYAFRSLGQVNNPSDATQNISLRQMVRPSTNRKIIYELVQNLSGLSQNKSLMINAQGFRGPAYSTLKDDHTIRIVGLGDSYMFGWGVSDEECYLIILSQHLNQSAPDEYHWEIINTAVPGYNTVMEVETFKGKALQYYPDLVIIEYVGNDLHLPNFIRKPDNYFSLSKSYMIEYFASRLRRQQHAFDGILVDAPLHPYEHDFENDPSRVPEQYKDMVGIAAYRRAMAELKALSRQYNFLVVVYTHGYFPVPVKESLQDLSFPSIEAGDIFKGYMVHHGIKEYMGSPLSVSRTDSHPSALGHAMVAGILFTYLHDSGVLNQILRRRGIL
ncbi:MAG: SGNH/GDSL hydrolase family protein [Candidatus Entotheonellia bacterium]